MAKKTKNKIASYLASLKFKPELFKSIQAKYLANYRLCILLTIAIVLMGSIAFSQIPRRLTPEIKIPIVIVSTVLPGASPQDIERLVTIPIEEEISTLAGIDTLSSVSSENISFITVQFASSTDSTQARNDVQAQVQSAVIKLPDDVLDPSVKLLDFENQPVWIFSLTGKTNAASLMRAAAELKAEIEKENRIDRVELWGFSDTEIVVEIDPSRLTSLSLSPAVLSGHVRRALMSYPAGNIQTSQTSFSLTINPQIQNIQDIGDLKINLQDQTIKLSEVAAIFQKPKKNQQIVFLRHNNQPVKEAVQFSIYKTSASNIGDAQAAAEKTADKFRNKYNNVYEIITIENSAREISEQFGDLYHEFSKTILLVFALLLVFLGLRQAIVTSITIPLTFLASFAIINYLGLSLNFLTLFALLLTLGLLIDDTIVVVAAMTRYYKTGKFSPRQTGILVWQDFIVPLWSTTIATIWAFLPLLITSGIIGEFIKPLPIVVTVTMISSTSIATLITISLMTVVLKPNLPNRVKILIKSILWILIASLAPILAPRNMLWPFIAVFWIIFLYVLQIHHAKIIIKLKRLKVLKCDIACYIKNSIGALSEGIINIEKLSIFYMKIIRRILISPISRKRTLMAIFIFVLVAYILVPLGFVKNEFFPKTDENLLYVNVELPAGTNNNIVKNEAEQIIKELEKTPYIQTILVQTGQQGRGGFLQGASSDSNYFFATLRLKESQHRDQTSQQIANDLRGRLKDYQKGNVKIEELSGGPPVGADIQVKLLGEDLGVLNSLADDLLDYLKKQEGILNTEKSITQNAPKYVFVPDYDKLADAGITVDQMALTLRTFASGFELGALKIQDEQIPIVLKLKSQADPENIYQLSVAGPRGEVPLYSLAELELENNPTRITRENGQRTISVSAAVGAEYNITQKNRQFLDYISKLKLPDGYSYKTGGVNEENQKSVASIFQAMLISAILILTTMIIEFKSFRQSFIALLIIPVSIAGVFYIFALFNIPLSFPALIGVLALFGIVVTHAIVVIEKINDNRREGLPLIDAVVDGAGNRLEPVLLTSLATIFGLIPITISDPLWRGLGGAIIAGLLFSGAIKLFMVPVLYVEFFGEKVTSNK